VLAGRGGGRGVRGREVKKWGPGWGGAWEKGGKGRMAGVGRGGVGGGGGRGAVITDNVGP